MNIIKGDKRQYSGDQAPCACHLVITIFISVTYTLKNAFVPNFYNNFVNKMSFVPKKKQSHRNTSAGAI